MFVFLVSLVLGLAGQALGHGMLLEPVARTSLWREDPTVLPNYDDNGLFCGGRQVQWEQNEGRCGLCGDNWASPRPRSSELNGTYDFGKIPRRYIQGSEMPVGVMITANHLGNFKFAICSVDEFGKETEKCFDKYPLKLTNGDDMVPVPTSETGWYNATVQLPKDLTCKHCVVQWTYVTGNSWGICESGEGKLGCGPVQEYFRTCSDIAILPKFGGHKPGNGEDKVLEEFEPEVPEVVEWSADNELDGTFADKVAEYVLERK